MHSLDQTAKLVASADLNLSIIDLLREDGRRPNKEMAALLGVSSPTIAARIRAMQDARILHVTAQRRILSHPTSNMAAIIEFHVDDLSDSLSVQSALKQIPELVTIYRTSRRPELVAHIRADSPSTFSRALKRVAQTVPNLKQMTTRPIIELFHYSSDYGMLTENPVLADQCEDENEHLIALLQADGRQSNRSLAGQLGMSESAVRQRLIKLQKEGQIRIGVVVDPRAWDLTVWAEIRMTVQPAYIEQAAQALKTLDHLSLVAHISGEANLAIFTLHRSNSELDEFIESKIRPLAGLTDFSIMRINEIVHHDYNYSL